MLTNDQINREFERLNFRYRLQEILETNDLIDLWSNGWLDKTEDPYIDGVFDQVREYIGKIVKLEDGLRLYLEKIDLEKILKCGALSWSTVLSQPIKTLQVKIQELMSSWSKHLDIITLLRTWKNNCYFIWRATHDSLPSRSL